MNSAPAQAARAIAIPLVLFLAVIAQVTVVNRLPLPGGTGPDLVLLTVAALAVSSGPMLGTIAGFAGGLALDVAPPASHYAGEYALVFAIIGYAAGRTRKALEDYTGERDALTTLAVLAAAVALGEAGKAAIGRALADPGVTTAAIERLLPTAVFYDLILTPVALGLGALLIYRERPERAPHPGFTVFALPSAFRAAGNGAAPGLRLAGSSNHHLTQPPVRKEPKLRLAAGSSSGSSRTYRGSAVPSAFRPAGGPTAKLNFSSNHPASVNGHSANGHRPVKAPPKGWLTADRRPHSTRQGHRPARPANFRHPGGPAHPGGHPAYSSHPARPGRTPRSGWLSGTASALATRAALRPARSSGPAKGWLRGASLVPAPAKKATPGKGWLRSGSLAPPAAKKATPGKGWLRPARARKLNWYTSGPSSRWLRQSKSRARWTAVTKKLARKRNKRLIGGRR